ncbi:MAG: signal peptide peptidase SppA [Rubrivivax sp.]|nr:signal peptide peptidase SppA [Rubrivivax sp.]
MPSSPVSSFGRVLRSLWWLLDTSRRALLNLLLLLLIALGVWAAFKSGPPSIEPRTALVIDLAGPVVEQRAGSLREGALRQLRGQDDGATRLRDVIAVLDAAARDEHVPHALLMLDEFDGAGLPTLREIAAAIERFKAAGKPVYAWGSSFDQRQYYLAAHATEIWLHPMGMVYIEGYGRYRNYYKDLLDRVGVTANVLRVGKFKNFAETWSANAPSQESLEAEGALYTSLWQSWTGSVEKARRLPAGSVAQAIESLPGSLQAAGGNPARWALERKWVDALKTRDEVRALLVERGARDDDGQSFRQVSLPRYLDRVEPARGGDAVGVIVAQGEISDGRAPAGRIGGLSTAELVRKARDDDEIKAIVLRVNSPGGSAFGSELVRRELELTRQAGKPVVVSMGDVAASGGYWISMAADEVIADEATITGSIGVVAVLPTAAGAMDKLGVHTGGVTTTWLAGAYDPRRAFDPRFGQLVQSVIDRAYVDFITLAAKARQTTPAAIDEVGQGRVWSGRQAVALGLVDRTGGLNDALDAAARRAKLGSGHRVQYLEAEPGRLQRLLQDFGATVGAAIGRPVDVQGALLALGLAPALAPEVAHDLGWLAEVAERRQPFAAVVHCLCAAP